MKADGATVFTVVADGATVVIFVAHGATVFYLGSKRNYRKQQFFNLAADGLQQFFTFETDGSTTLVADRAKVFTMKAERNSFNLGSRRSNSSYISSRVMIIFRLVTDRTKKITLVADRATSVTLVADEQTEQHNSLFLGSRRMNSPYINSRRSNIFTLVADRATVADGSTVCTMVANVETFFYRGIFSSVADGTIVISVADGTAILSEKKFLSWSFHEGFLCAILLLDVLLGAFGCERLEIVRVLRHPLKQVVQEVARLASMKTGVVVSVSECVCS
ncbi:hypothetical protein DPMN_104391 [Dreissena polymorpha]|uniref:Uncharacterized protein n=1 Tax=Dreissena polymorpha TaxID=45954 RepID=A0A9D4H7M9_DREPO|nr:hypothetical protein DPMN_104391 [Dreissena polymorpha]